MRYIRQILTGRAEGGFWQLGVTLLLTALLFALAAAGMAYVSGFTAVWSVLEHPHWGWLAGSAAAELISFACYAVAYRGVGRVEGGPFMSAKPLLAVVASGFGGFLVRGARMLDRHAIRSTGAGEHEASARVTALGALELGALPFIVWPTALALWVLGVARPRPSFVIPWAVIPPIGFVVVIWVAERWRDRLRHRPGWRGRAAVFLDGTHYVWMLIRHPVRCDAALIGMLLFWGVNMFSMWAALAAFGLHMTAGSLIVCYGSAYLASQRTAPLGGSGLLMTVLVPTLWYAGGIPLAVATVAVFAHRFFSLWLFMPIALSSLPALRALRRRGELPRSPITA